MQGKEETSSGQSRICKTAKEQSQFLTKPCAKSIGGVACSAGKQDDAARRL